MFHFPKLIVQVINPDCLVELGKIKICRDVLSYVSHWMRARLPDWMASSNSALSLAM